MKILPDIKLLTKRKFLDGIISTFLLDFVFFFLTIADSKIFKNKRLQKKIIANSIANFIVALSGFHKKRNKREGKNVFQLKKAFSREMATEGGKGNDHNSLPSVQSTMDLFFVVSFGRLKRS